MEWFEGKEKSTMWRGNSKSSAGTAGASSTSGGVIEERLRELDLGFP
ncbi:hypothetical protein [Thermococcus pacificus]|nr:hypothetical protein [Thermococcus pacificus]